MRNSNNSSSDRMAGWPYSFFVCKRVRPLHEGEQCLEGVNITRSKRGYGTRSRMEWGMRWERIVLEYSEVNLSKRRALLGKVSINDIKKLPISEVCCLEKRLWRCFICISNITLLYNINESHYKTTWRWCHKSNLTSNFWEEVLDVKDFFLIVSKWKRGLYINSRSCKIRTISFAS